MSVWSALFSARPSTSPANANVSALSFTDRVKALQNLPLLFQLIWETSPIMTVANLLLRVMRAAIPLTTLYIGKIIIDEVVRLSQLSGEPNLTYVWMLVGAEFGLAVVADVLRRSVALLDSLLGDRFSIYTSVRVMEHAASLDMERF